MRSRVLCVIMAVAFLTLFVTGCGGSSNDGDRQSTAATTQEAGKTAETTLAEEKGLEDYTDEMKITAYQGMNYGGPSSGQDTEYAKYVKKRFKINVDEFVWPAGEDVYQKIGTFIASGDMPDIIQAPVDAKGKVLFNSLAEAGMVLDVEPYLNQYCPETMKYFTPTILDAYRYVEDNKLYVVPGFAVNPDLKDELTVAVNQVLIYREDLLKKIGMDVPKTPDELYNVLKAIKGQKASSGKDIIPFSPLYMGAEIQGNIGGMFGIQKYHARLNDAEQKLIDMHEGPEYLAYMKYAAKLFREGLMNPESYSMSWQKLFNELVPNGEVGITVMWPSEILGLNLQLEKNAPGQKYLPMPQPKAEGVGNSELGYISTLGISAIAISKNVSDPERLFKYINWMSGKEGWATMVWGPPSKDSGCWYIGDDGKLIDNKEIQDKKIAENPKWTVDVLGSWAYGLPGILKYTQDLVLDQARQPEELRKMAKDMYDGEIFMDTIFDIFTTSEDGPIAKQKRADVNKIFTEREAKILMNSRTDEQVEEGYNAMMEEAKKAGLQEILKEDYQRYQEVKAKYSK